MTPQPVNYIKASLFYIHAYNKQCVMKNKIKFQVQDNFYTDKTISKRKYIGILVND